jgi:hypothetical protein
MVYIRVALSDPDIGGKPQSHRVDLTISDDQTIIAVYNGLCGSIFFDLLNSNSRGLDFVVFSGKNNVTLESCRQREMDHSTSEYQRCYLIFYI